MADTSTDPPSEMTHGGRLAARALANAGVDVVFTLSGGHVMGIYDGCLDEGIKVVDVRHEQAAVHAADAWARLHPGKVGVAILTAGPGVTDGVTGVANAWAGQLTDPRDRRTRPVSTTCDEVRCRRWTMFR